MATNPIALLETVANAIPITKLYVYPIGLKMITASAAIFNKLIHIPTRIAYFASAKIL